MTRISFSRLRASTALVFASALAAGSLVACSGDDSKADDQTLSFLSSFTTGNATGDQFNKIAKQFTDQTGIKIDVDEAKGDDLKPAYEASVLAGKERDIVILNLTPDTTGWLPQGQVVDVKKYMDQWGISDKLIPDAKEYWTRPEGVTGFPFIGFNWPIWYNTELLKKGGVTDLPKTTDDLIAGAQKLRGAGVGPMTLGGAEWPVQNWVAWMVQQYTPKDESQKLFEKGGYCNSPNAIKGLDLFGKLRDANVFLDNVQGYTADQMSNAYFQKQASIMPAGSWAYTQVPKEVADTTTLAGFPLAPDGVYKKPTAFQGHSAGFFLSKNGAKKIGSVEKFFKFLYSQEVLQGWVSEASQILDVKADAIGPVQSTQPLVVQGAALTDEKVDYMVLPDGYLPAGMDYQPAATEFIGKKGMKGSEFCKTLDKLYQK